MGLQKFQYVPVYGAHMENTLQIGSTIYCDVLIIGAGAIGTEFASYFNILGSEVTLAVIEETILPAEDGEVSKRLQSIFKQKGITVLTGYDVNNIEATFDTVLVSVGRAPNTSDIGLDSIGIETDKNGFIPVNSKMQTIHGSWRV